MQLDDHKMISERHMMSREHSLCLHLSHALHSELEHGHPIITLQRAPEVGESRSSATEQREQRLRCVHVLSPSGLDMGRSAPTRLIAHAERSHTVLVLHQARSRANLCTAQHGSQVSSCTGCEPAGL